MTYNEFSDKLNKLLFDEGYENFDILSTDGKIELYVTTTGEKINSSKLLFIDYDNPDKGIVNYLNWLSQWKLEHIRSALELSIDCGMFDDNKIILIMQQMIQKVIDNKNWADLSLDCDME